MNWPISTLKYRTILSEFQKNNFTFALLFLGSEMDQEKA